MTAPDDPSPEQQLADVIRAARFRHDVPGTYGAQLPAASSERIAAAIVAAVNSGDVDPIVPKGKLVVAEDDLRGVLIDNLTDVVAELAELRALKAKINSLGIWYGQDGTQIAYADQRDFEKPNALLDWLREPSDG